MNYTNYRITLDMYKEESQVTIPVPQGDTARRLYIYLFHNGEAFVLTGGTRAVFIGEKEDGTLLYNDCVIENQNLIRYDFTEQTTAVIGKLTAQIRVYGENGLLITSPKLTVVVYENVFSENTITSSDEFSALTQLMEEANGLIFEVNQKLENGEFVGKSGVYVGSGEMPEGFNVQIDPFGDLCFETGKPHLLYLNENGDFSFLEMGEGLEIENGKIQGTSDTATKQRVEELAQEMKLLSESSVKSVNGKAPDRNGNVAVTAETDMEPIKAYIDEYISSALGGDY